MSARNRKFYVNLPKVLLDDPLAIDKLYAYLSDQARKRFGHDFKSMQAVPVEPTRSGTIRYEVQVTL